MYTLYYMVLLYIISTSLTLLNTAARGKEKGREGGKNKGREGERGERDRGRKQGGLLDITTLTGNM